MRLPDFQYMAPKSIREVSLFLNDYGKESKIMSGGTDILPSMKQRIFRPRYLVHLNGISDLSRIEFDEKSGLRIGALVRLRALEKDLAILERYPIIKEAVTQIGSVQIRQMGTVGGNLCLDTRCYYYNQSSFWRSCRPRCIKMGGEICNAVGGGKKCFAIFSGDLAPAFIALGAKINLLSASGERTLLLSDFYTGDGAKPLALNPEEILTRVEVPSIPKDTFNTYFKYRIRKSIDFPITSLAVLLTLAGKERTCREVKMVVGAVGSRPEEMKEIEELLKGKEIKNPIVEEASDLAFKAAKPIANAASSPAYRKRMIKVFVGRALKQALGREM